MMSNNYNFSGDAAQQRANFFNNQNEIKERFRRKKTFSDNWLNMEFSEWKMRRIAPLAILIYAFTIIFGISWLYVQSSQKVATIQLFPNQSQLATFNIPKEDAIYLFKLKQSLNRKNPPSFSELELEIVDSEYGHVYSFYKDLWQELHPNEEGTALKVYSDDKIKFDIELAQKGGYFLRAISHSNHPGPIIGEIYMRKTGALYFGFYTIIFLCLSILLLVGSSAWGTPKMMFNILSKIRSLRKNTVFLWTLSVCSLIYISCIIISVTHYGYASSGNDSTGPTQFYKKDNVKYLG